MSWQATTWAITQKIVKNAAARHVLLCLANYAGEDGCDAFPSVGRLVSDTGLSERTVQEKLAELQSLGAIRKGNQAIAAAKISRADRRPTCYDLCMERGADAAPRSVTGCNSRNNGVQMTQERGAPAAPEPSLELSIEQVEPPELEAAFETYQKMAESTGLPRVEKFTDKRRAQLRARLDDYGAARWASAMARVGASAFCHGQNDRKWKADLDFLLRPDSVAKVLEGKYDGRANVPQLETMDERGIWQRRLAQWVRNGVWNPDWGNPPDARGCEAPSDLLKSALAARKVTA